MEIEKRDYEQLLAEKAGKLEELRRRKPGQKHYKRSLRAYLDADAAVQSALLSRIDTLVDGRRPGPQPPV